MVRGPRCADVDVNVTMKAGGLTQRLATGGPGGKDVVNPSPNATNLWMERRVSGIGECMEGTTLYEGAEPSDRWKMLGAPGHRFAATVGGNAGPRDGRDGVCRVTAVLSSQFHKMRASRRGSPGQVEDTAHYDHEGLAMATVSRSRFKALRRLRPDHTRSGASILIRIREGSVASSLSTAATGDRWVGRQQALPDDLKAIAPADEDGLARGERKPCCFY